MTQTKILLIDDEKDFIIGLSKTLLAYNFFVKSCLACEEALRLLEHEFFDIVVCDVRLPFYGLPEGGLEMAREVSERSPASFTVIVSQYVTDLFVNRFMATVQNKKYCFLTKDNTFSEKLITQIKQVLTRKSIFVCMPFDEEFDDIYELGIKRIAFEMNFLCERADEIQHNGGILEKLCKSIRSSHIIIADMTTKNPNVFYEVGYAHAIGRDVILLTQNAESIPIDLRSFNHIIYKRNKLTELNKSLKKRIDGLLK